MRAYFSEGLGTFILVFIGTGSVIADGYSGGAVTLVGISLAFGLAVFAMVNALGEVSGAHINPAVTIGLCVAGRAPGSILVPYIASQCAGAICASLLLRLMFGTIHGLGGTAPAGSSVLAFTAEVVTTFILMLVILCVTVGAKEKGITAGVVIGGVVAMDILFAGPISGGSMNPARSLGPALAGLELGSLWIYLIAPCVGAGLAAVAVRVLYPASPGDAAEVSEAAEEFA